MAKTCETIQEKLLDHYYSDQRTAGIEAVDKAIQAHLDVCEACRTYEQTLALLAPHKEQIWDIAALPHSAKTISAAIEKANNLKTRRQQLTQGALFSVLALSILSLMGLIVSAGGERLVLGLQGVMGLIGLVSAVWVTRRHWRAGM